MKGFFYFLLYSFLLLLIGRNLAFLPRIDFRSAAQQTKDIKTEISQYLEKQDGDFSVFYKDLSSGEEFGIDENKVLKGASLNKVYIVAYLYHLAQEGKIDLEERVIIQEGDIQDYGTGSIRYKGAGESYSLKTLAKLSLEQSDNTAAHILGVKLGMNNVQSYIKSLNLSSTNMGDNKTTAKDFGKLLDLLYNKKITTPSYTAELLDFLKDTDFEDRLPRLIGKEIAVYHKTGDAVKMIHDGGIIGDKKPFILVVLSNDVPDEEKSKIVIGEIAKKIYVLKEMKEK